MKNELSGSLSLRALQRAAHDTAVANGWWDKERSIPEQVVLMHSELSEAVEELRKTDPRSFYVIENGKPEGWGVELADCVIRIMDTCQYYGVDLQGLIELKMRYNETRPHRHGGKNL